MERNLTHSTLKASVVDDSVFSEYFYRTTCRGNPSEISRYYSRVKWWAFFKMEIIRKRNGLDKETCFSLVWEGLWKINSLHLTQFSAKYYVTLKYNSVGLRIIINHLSTFILKYSKLGFSLLLTNFVLPILVIKLLLFCQEKVLFL